MTASNICKKYTSIYGLSNEAYLIFFFIIAPSNSFLVRGNAHFCANAGKCSHFIFEYILNYGTVHNTDISVMKGDIILTHFIFKNVHFEMKIQFLFKLIFFKNRHFMALTLIFLVSEFKLFARLSI